MADTITFQSSTPSTPPDTTVIATDDAGAGGHVQIVKLAISTDGSATALTADNTDGLLVNLGTNNDITGTVTANLGATDNAVLDAIQAAVEVIDNAISGSEMQVDVLTLPAIPAGTNNIGDVDILSIAAGDNNIGNVDIASIAAGDNNIGNVDVASIVPGTGATNLGKAEDDAHSSGDVGVMALGVRQSTQADFGADGDYAPFSIDDDGGLRVSVVAGSAAGTEYTEDAVAEADPVGTALIMVRDDALSAQTSADGDNIAARGTDKGELYVKHVDAIPVTDNNGALTVDNGGTFAVQVDGDALTALQLIDDTVFAEDVAAQAADKGIAILAVRRDADTSLVDTDNDYANLQVDANGYLKVEIFDGGGSHTVDGTVTANLGATDNAVLDAIQAAVEIIDNAISGSEMQVDVLTLPAIPAGTNNIGDVDILSIAAGDNNIGNVDIASIAAGDNNIGNVDLASAIPAGSNLIGQVNPQPAASGGLLIFRSLDLDESEEEVKGTPGQVYGWFITNLRTSAIYVKFYNDTAANVAVGTTVPEMTLVIPGNASDFIAANALGGIGIEFDTAITVAATTGLADNDTGAPGANECVVNIFYK